MMARDIFHEQARVALEKDGWLITDDPYILRYEGVRMEADLGAEKLIGAQKNNTKIAVEIKSFAVQSKVYEWHSVVGQFENYTMALEKQEPDRQLFLAIPNFVHNEFFETPFVRDSIKRHDIRLIVFNPMEKMILEWRT